MYNVKGIIGSAFVIASSILCAAKYIAATAVAVASGIWGKEEFTQALKFTPTLLNVAMYSALIVGIIFIIMGLKDESDRAKG